ncbi:MAG TPA: hypothetical protein VKV39_18495 [Candidatus Sulfotelmatobacter sp.]|nr:hypothetical protein [Candidatus Sulfotelmatobacter sp.]
MKFRNFLPLAAFLAISTFVAAQPSGAGLGTIEGAADFCAEVNPHLIGQVAGFKLTLVRGISEKDLFTIMNSSDFRGAYSSMHTTLEKAPRSQVVSACNSTFGAATQPLRPIGKK